MNVMSFGVLHTGLTNFLYMKDYHKNALIKAPKKKGIFGRPETDGQRDERWSNSARIVMDAIKSEQIVLLQGVSLDYKEKLTKQNVSVHLSYNMTKQYLRHYQGGPAVCYPPTRTVDEFKELSKSMLTTYPDITVPHGWAAVRINSTWYVSVHLKKKKDTTHDKFNSALLQDMHDTIVSSTKNFAIVIGGNFNLNNATEWMQNIWKQPDMSKISIVGNSPTKFDMQQNKTDSRDEIWISGKPRGQVTVKCDTPMQPWATDNKVGSDHCPIEWVGTTSGSPAGAPGFLSLTVIVATFILVL
eukprot:GEMP01014599.1.p2 GENE.GEMP01014599.1~~GEMP01014599.1.p2  ORF type:complete len:300 (-),score=33.82 GEMP01014599.1:360-1259(-)